MNDLVIFNEEMNAIVLDSRVAARELGVDHKSLKNLIREYAATFGEVPFQKAPLESGQTETFALLTERQALLFIALAKNTEAAIVAKTRLVDAFLEMREYIETTKRNDFATLLKKMDDIAQSLYDQINWSYSRIAHSDPVNKELLERGEKTIARFIATAKSIKGEIQ